MEDLKKTGAGAPSAPITSRSDLALLAECDAGFIRDVCRTPCAFYTEFSIPKANGESRVIRPPRRQLRSVQRRLLLSFYQRAQLRGCLHGGIRGKSTVTHARVHVGQTLVATLDIRKFFPSTTSQHLIPVIHALGFIDEAAVDVLGLVTLDGCLPQGSPTSSLLANLAFAPGDARFIRLCRRHCLRYSRYVDDIAISGDGDFQDLRGPFIEAIKSADYEVAADKIHFLPDSERQVVTGLVVNDRLRPTREFVTEVKHEIRLCLDYGAAVVAAGNGETVPALKGRLTGQVSHIKYVDPPLGKRLRGRLCGVDWRSTRPELA